VDPATADAEVVAAALAVKSKNNCVKVLAQLRRPRARDHLQCVPGWRIADRAVAVPSLSMTLLGVGRSALYQWKAGKVGPLDRHVLERLSYLFGIYAALHRGSLADRVVMMLSVAGFTIPSFVLGLTLVLIFAVKLGWLPSGGQDSWRHAILPIITLGIGGAAVLARFTRSAMLEVLGQPFIRTASAKGVPWRRVITGHALPNAAIPTVTIVGFMIGTLIAGAVVVESVFSWPGVGRLLVVAVANRDLAVVQCILLLVAATMVTSNLIVDFLYGFLDPRLRQNAGKAA
jgi:ABC-type antimicrobial peptide transport system permease subunit